MNIAKMLSVVIMYSDKNFVTCIHPGTFREEPRVMSRAAAELCLVFFSFEDNETANSIGESVNMMNCVFTTIKRHRQHLTILPYTTFHHDVELSCCSRAQKSTMRT